MSAPRPEDNSRLRWASGPAAAASPVRNRRLWWASLLMIAVAIAILAGTWIHNRVENALQQVVAEHLLAILQTDIAALEFWLEQEHATAVSWAQEAQLRSMTQRLQETSSASPGAPGDLRDAPEQARLRELLEPLLDTDNYVGYVIADRTGLILAASEIRSIGERLSVQGQSELAAALAQQAGWIPPFWKGHYLDSATLEEDTTLMGVSASIADGSGRPLAALLLFIPPEKDFTRILSVARMGNSGDTYAFNVNGRMLSDTRHLDELKAAGILPPAPTVRAVLRVELRDPGGNLLGGYRTDTPMTGRPLTRLVLGKVAREARQWERDGQPLVNIGIDQVLVGIALLLQERAVVEPVEV